MTTLGSFSLERAVSAVEKVRQRLLKAANALRTASAPYAVAGDNAVAAWVSRVDEAAVRNTQDVDILVRRADFDAARRALETAGFVYRHVASIDAFLDSASSSPRDGVHIVFANERVRAHEPASNPDVSESEDAGAFRVLSLAALVQIKLTSFRDKDRVHLRDLIGVGLIDASWVDRLRRCWDKGSRGCSIHRTDNPRVHPRVRNFAVAWVQEVAHGQPHRAL